MKRTILITGSSRGIGKATAQLAHEAGYKVILHGKTDSLELKELHKKLKGSLKVFFDVGDTKAVQEGIYSVLKEVDVIDVLVNNAGIRANKMDSMENLDIDAAKLEWDVNVMGTLCCIKAVLPAMLKKGSGVIISVSSIKGQYNLATTSSLTYSATKAGIISITKALAKTYAEKGIRFNCISPGYIKTDQVKEWSEETIQRINTGTLAQRMGNPEEVAELVLFLASEKSTYINGTDILIDGGYSIKGK
jgi:3-oxoacyl-[acyl-carrier protein] reductase